VHLTSDGVLVAFHDEQLDRVTDRTGTIKDLPWREVSQARIGGSEPIPTLAELLEAFPEALFNIDAKTDDAVVALAHILRRHDAVGRVCVAAFSDERLHRMRGLLGPELCTAAGPHEVAKLIALAKLRPGGARSTAKRPAGGPEAATPFQCVQVPVRHGHVTIVTPELLRTVHARGYVMHVWTIDEPDEMHRLLDMGVDGIMTDRPSVLRGVLADRGEWN
jgi:glycerophosphoryl diester phosphodiesterase